MDLSASWRKAMQLGLAPGKSAEVIELALWVTSPGGPWYALAV